MNKTFFILVVLFFGANSGAKEECFPGAGSKGNVEFISTLEACVDAVDMFDACSITTDATELIAERQAVIDVCLSEHRMSEQDRETYVYIQNMCAAKYSAEKNDLNRNLGISSCEMEGATFLNNLLAPFVEPII